MGSLRDLVARCFFEVHGEEKLEHLGEQIEGIHKKIEFLAGAELVKGLYELAERFSGVGERLESASMAAGLTTDKFQALAFAASQNAVSQEELGGALARFSRVLGSAKDGSKEAIAQFAKVGITRDQVMGFGDAGDAMMALADRVKDIQDPIKRTQVLMGLLGRGSANMTKLMSVGSAGIRDKMRQAAQIGAIVSAENIENLANMEDAVSALSGVFKAAAANMAGYFAPAIIEVVRRVQQFWVANHKIIEENFEKWAEKAAYALGFVVGLLKGAGTALFEFADAHKPLIAMVSDLIAKFIEFKAATGLVAAGFGFIAGPFKQLGAGLTIIATTLSFIKGNWPILVKCGTAIASFASDVAAATIGIGGGAGVAILTALVVAAHDAYVLLTTGNVEDMWLYKLIMAIKSLSIAALTKLNLYSPDGGVQDAKDAAMAMPLSAIAGPDAVTSRPIDFGSPADFRYSDVMDNIGDLSQAQRAPGASSGAVAQASPAANTTYNIDAPITVNVPANADPKMVAEAAKAGVTDHLNSMLRDTHTSQKQALVF